MFRSKIQFAVMFIFLLLISSPTNVLAYLFDYTVTYFDQKSGDPEGKGVAVYVETSHICDGVDWFGPDGNKLGSCSPLDIDGCVSQTAHYPSGAFSGKTFYFYTDGRPAGQYRFEISHADSYPAGTTQICRGYGGGEIHISDSFQVGLPVEKPNLKALKPTNWPSRVIVSSTTGTTIDQSNITSLDDLYIDFAIGNKGTAATARPFTYSLLVDKVKVGTWTRSRPLDFGGKILRRDIPIGRLSPGVHKIKVLVDVPNAIAELNETDNIYIRYITVN